MSGYKGDRNRTLLMKPEWNCHLRRHQEINVYFENSKERRRGGTCHEQELGLPNSTLVMLILSETSHLFTFSNIQIIHIQTQSTHHHSTNIYTSHMDRDTKHTTGKRSGGKRRRAIFTSQQPDILAILNKLNERFWNCSDWISFPPTFGGGSAMVGITRIPSS